MFACIALIECGIKEPFQRCTVRALGPEYASCHFCCIIVPKSEPTPSREGLNTNLEHKLHNSYTTVTQKLQVTEQDIRSHSIGLDL
jgi:hypothetical protein